MGGADGKGILVLNVWVLILRYFTAHILLERFEGRLSLPKPLSVLLTAIVLVFSTATRPLE